jgi:hypothetical protein
MKPFSGVVLYLLIWQCLWLVYGFKDTCVSFRKRHILRKQLNALSSGSPIENGEGYQVRTQKNKKAYIPRAWDSLEQNQLFIKRLKENLAKKEFHHFQQVIQEYSRKNQFIHVNQKDELVSVLKEWNTFDHNDEERANVLRSLADLHFSVFNSTDKILIDKIMESYIEKRWKSTWSFSIFITAIKKLNYHWKILDETRKQEFLKLFDYITGRKKMTERGYTEILAGISGLGIRWSELNENTRRNLLDRIDEMKDQLIGFHLIAVIFHFGKLGAIIKESEQCTPHSQLEDSFMELVLKALEFIEVDSFSYDKGQQVDNFLSLYSAVLLFFHISLD